MLLGRAILVVEAQYIVALDIEAMLEGLGAARVIIAQDAAHAAIIAADWEDCTLAIVELERERPDQIALAGALARRGIPVIGLTTDRDLPQALAWISNTPIVLKPVQSDHLIEALTRIIAEASSQNE